MTEAKIEAWLEEDREFAPSAAFAAQANAQPSIYDEAAKDPVAWWRTQANRLTWDVAPTSTLEWDLPNAKWFADGTLNASVSCIDVHVKEGRGNRVAFHWVADAEGESRTITYHELLRQVCRTANALQELGVKKGDRVAVYMPMIPEAIIAMLAIVRLGAIHSVVFGGFSAEALSSRILDSDCRFVVTADGAFRRGTASPLKSAVDEALKSCPNVSAVLVVKRTDGSVEWVEGRDHWWHDLMAAAAPDCPAEEMDSEDPLYILYTSGTTGKPKGLVHTTGGYAVQTYLTAKYVFDLKDQDIFWCTADIGWVTGHSYVVYGPLQNGATVLMYEGAPNWPDFSRFWKIVDDHQVTIFYTAPTAIRAFIKWGDQHVTKHKLDSLRLLGTVGEPINPETWMWYREKIGHNRCPIVDTWWQTETGSIMIAPIPGAVPAKPGSATRPFFGIQAEVVNKEGVAVPAGHGGLLVIRKPWPSMARTVYGDPERYQKTYWSDVEGCYFTGDGARMDADGYFWLMGRVDDVINVSGHRLGTMEVESALVAHPKVAEAAVVGRPDELKGQAISAFVSLESGNQPSEELKDELRKWVSKEIGSLARPDDIRFTEALPKTRSGKIMRRLLRELATHGEIKGDTTTLEDFTVIAKLREAEEG